MPSVMPRPSTGIQLSKVIPRLKVTVRPRHQNLKTPAGPKGRLERIGRNIEALFKYERIELRLPICVETRPYAERLITEAIRHGDCHPATMEMADFWLRDKQMIHKLFKVLVPRFQNYKTSFTETYMIPDNCQLAVEKKHNYFFRDCVMELRGNPYPPMPRKPKANEQSLTNILLREAAKDYRKMKAKIENSDS